MPYIQPNDSSAFRPVNQANRSQLCRGNDAKCCRQCGQYGQCSCSENACSGWDIPPCPVCGQTNCTCRSTENHETESCTHQERCSGQPTAMVYHVDHDLERMFQLDQALFAGTLFTELYKPMKCSDGPCSGCASRHQLLAFVAWELRLYLNTHPCDQQALALYRRLCRQLEDPNYATTFDMDDGKCASWNWVDAPWPWEYQRCGHEKEGKH